MGNTLSKLLVGSVISVSLTSNGILINGGSNKFDRVAFERAWKEFLRNQAIERGLDVSKYYKEYSTKSASRSILMDKSSASEVQIAIQTATPLNEQLYAGIPKDTTFQLVSKGLLKSFKSLSEEIQEGDLKGSLQFDPSIVDFKTNNPPSTETANVLGVLAKIIWTKGKQKGVAPQYHQFAEMMDVHFGSIPGDSNSKFSQLPNDEKRIYGHFYFGKAQIEYATDSHDAAIASVDTAVQIAENINDPILKYRALETKARSWREKRGVFLDKSWELSKKLEKESNQPWVIAYALNNMDVLFKRKDGKFGKSKEEIEAIYQRCITIRRDLGDLQGVASSNSNRGKAITSGDNPEWADAYKLQELSRDWRVANEDTWGVAGSDFTIGKYYLEMNAKKFGGPIFHGMAIRKFITGLKRFRIASAKLGYAELSEYFSIGLHQIYDYERRKHGKKVYENVDDQTKAEEYQQQVLEDAKVAVKLTLFFRGWAELGLEKDVYPTLRALEFINDQQLKSLQKDEKALEPIQTELTASSGWRRDVNNPSEPPEQVAPDALKLLDELLKKYKNYGLDPKRKINYFNVLDARDEVRNENYLGMQILDLNYDDYMIGRTFFDMAGMQPSGIQGEEQVGKGMLQMLGAIKFRNVLTHPARLAEIGVTDLPEQDKENSLIYLSIKRALEVYGSSNAHDISMGVKNDLIELLNKFIQCQSNCINNIANDCHCTW